jgi:hypothetical protein
MENGQTNFQQVMQFNDKIQEALANTVQYVLEKTLPKLCKKYLGIRTKQFKLLGNTRRVPKKVCPIFIYNYLEEFNMRLSSDVNFRDQIYIVKIPSFHFF